ncbi:hypothetical protein R84981_002252 [Carnimonas sp. R-84981]|uniref:enterotoxin A family protein n=1 Tax=Carnimonas bestiolae TaxID=3402172 RepID=UPI003EDC4BEF
MRLFTIAVMLCITALTSLSTIASPPEVVYRADNAPPDVIEAQGGFRPRAFNEPLSPIARSPSFSLYRHQMGGILARDTTAYVSTTRSMRFAHSWLMRDDGNGYIYHIRPTGNFVDLNASLGEFSMLPHQQEFAALGWIYWGQVRGWQQVTNGVLGTFVANPNYNARFNDPAVAGGSVPELAGFPPSHAAWRVPPWSELASCVTFTRPTRETDDIRCTPKVPIEESAERYFDTHDFRHLMMATDE